MFFDLVQNLNVVQAKIFSFSWLWLFFALFFAARALWLTYIQEHFRRSVKWTLIELRVPRELKRSPKAMEQVFVAMHALRNSYSSPKEHWWDGEITLWFSCEMVSFGGEIHFYMRVPEKHRNLIEAAFYSQYPDVEIVSSVEDYVGRFPASSGELEKQGYKFFGNELRLEKPDAYPIRTYIEFEAIEEEKQLDPISAVLETLAKVKPQEVIWIQILIRPADDAWKKAGEKLVKKLKEETGRTQVETAAGKMVFIERSPGEVEIMKAIERNLAKPGFEALIRYLYFASPEVFDANFGQRGVFAAFNQYASESLNRFKYNVKAWTRASIWFWPHIFPDRRLRARKERIWRAYRERRLFDDPAAPFTSKVTGMKAFHWGIGAQSMGRMVLNTEELATLFHLPTFAVLTGPLIKRAEARKVGPPAGLPIYGEEGEAELPGVK